MRRRSPVAAAPNHVPRPDLPQLLDRLRPRRRVERVLGCRVPGGGAGRARLRLGRHGRRLPDALSPGPAADQAPSQHGGVAALQVLSSGAGPARPGLRRGRRSWHRCGADGVGAAAGRLLRGGPQALRGRLYRRQARDRPGCRVLVGPRHCTALLASAAPFYGLVNRRGNGGGGRHQIDSCASALARRTAPCVAVFAAYWLLYAAAVEPHAHATYAVERTSPCAVAQLGGLQQAGPVAACLEPTDVDLGFLGYRCVTRNSQSGHQLIQTPRLVS